jgi:arylsulfatase A-like enzyme
MAALAAGALSCGGGQVPLPHAVVIITLDTTRADRLPVYGHASLAAPAIERLARDGAVFDRAESVAPLTLTAHTSLFPGLYPPRHGVRDNADTPLDAKHATLAEALKSRGFHTAAFVGSMVLASDRGLARGFDVYGDGRAAGGTVPRRRPANDVVDEALSWLDRQHASPFFLWVHLYDAHAPQVPPVEYQQKHNGDPYLGAIAFMDAQIGRLLEQIDFGRTAVIVAADHGESLGDHGEAEHGIFLYEAALRVPLIVHAPGVAASRVPGLASLVDIAPTVLDLVRVAPPDVDGVSLVPALIGKPLPDRAVYAESMYARRFGWSPPRMLLDGRFKFIDTPRPELYDLETDPFEDHDLSGERPTLVRGMRAGLNAMFSGTSERDTAGPPVDVAALASLGYVARTPSSPPAGGLDPKDFIEQYNATTRRRSMQ